MNYLKNFAIFSFALLLSTQLFARDDRKKFSIKTAMASADAKAKLGTDVKFFFGKSKSPKVKQNFGQFSTNKKTRAFGKSDQEACNWVFLSAMIKMRDRARQLGANAIINLKSYYKKVPYSSVTNYECGAGNIMAGVALTGEFVKI